MFFNFYGQVVQILSDDEAILERLAKDFSFFKKESLDRSFVFLTIRCFFKTYEQANWQLPWKESRNCRYHDQGSLRFYNYDEELWGEVDFSKEEASFYSSNIHLLHEVAYLYLLSRLGKKLETLGLFKIHSCALALGHETYLCPMLMKGGKSTLFLGALSAGPFEILSDDAPLVSRKGEILPFPMRVGLESFQHYDCYDSSEFYTLKRRRFGTKYLIDIASFKNPVAKNAQDNHLVLFRGYRVSNPGCVIKKTSKLSLIPVLFINLVVGYGLPYAREFYLENTFRDVWRLLGIAFGRLAAACRLLKRAQCYSLQLGNQPELNARALANFRSHDRR